MTQVQTGWTQEMIADLATARPVVVSVLKAHHRLEDVEDVLQEVFLAANQGLDRYEPDRAPFGHWVRGIAHRQAQRHVARIGSQRKRDEAVMALAGAGAASGYEPVAADIADLIVGQAADHARLHEVLRIVRQVVERKLFARSMTLVVQCDGHVREAAKRLGVEEATLRDSHRNILDTAAAVDKALALHHRRREQKRRYAPVTCKELLACLPDGDEDSRAWLSAVTRAVAEVKGGFRAVSPAEVAKRTGWSEVSCRHRLARTQALLLIVRAVIEDGDLS